MNQHKLIEQYMEAHGSITPMDAFMDLGITKLATRIGEMIQAGAKIKKTQEHGVNRFGVPVRYMRYERSV